MSISSRALAGACLFLAPISSGAQLAPLPMMPATISNLVMPAPVAPAAPVTAVLRAGINVPLKMSEALSTEGKKLRVGQRFQLEAASDITLEGMIVIPAGSPATGEITEVRNKGMWGKSGRVNARVLYVRANGRQIRLSGSIDDKGVTGSASVVGAIVLLPIAGFFMTGTSARIPLGAPVNAFVDEDVTVAFAAGTGPAPMLVSANPAMAAPVQTVAQPVPATMAPTAPAPIAVLTPVSATIVSPR